MHIKVYLASWNRFTPMNPITIETTLDVTAIPPRQKHPTIFRAWAELETGRALLLVNDHDPLPLYYQFTCEHDGGFKWEYIDRGPTVWRVRITKGNFPDPGFVPSKKPLAPAAAITSEPGPRILDTRPIFSQGQSPCEAIDEAAASLSPGQPLVLLVPFEPVPLYTKLGQQGFRHQSEQITDGTWRIEFRR
jgi:uncharacterized protein (DUF2249 family)